MTWSQSETEIYEQALSLVEKNNKILARMYLKTQKEIADKLKQFFLSVDPSSSKQYQAQRLSEIFKDINKRLTTLTGLTTKQIETAFLDQYKTVFNSYSYALGEYAGLLPLSIVSEAVIKKALMEPIGNYNFKQFEIYARKKLTEDLREQVGIALSKGEGPAKLAKRLKEVFQNGIARHTSTARTEMLRAFSVAQDESVSQALDQGIEFTYLWKANLDSRVRESHANENGKKAKILRNGMPEFTVGRSKGTGPRLLYGPDQARQVINCRCRRLNVPVV